MHKTLSIEINIRTVLQIFLVLVFLAILKHVLPLLGFFLIAALIGIGLIPLVDLAKRKKIPEWVSYLVITLMIFGSITLFFVFLIPSIANQVSGFIQHLPQYRTDFEASIGSEHVRDFIHNHVDQSVDQIGSIPEKIASIGKVTITTLSTLFLLIILSLYFLIDGRRVFRSLLDTTERYFSKETRDRVEVTGTELQSVISGYFTGQLTNCTFVAIYVYTVTQVLNIPGALTLTVIAAFFDWIPAIGFFCSLAISGLVALTISAKTALTLAILYVIYSLIENYFLVPRVFGKTLRLPGLVVILSILIGGKLGGIVGMLLALPIVGSWEVIERNWFQRKDR